MKRYTTLIAVLFSAVFLFSINKTGNWKFDNSTDLLKASTGTDLELVGSHSSIAGSNALDGAIQIAAGSFYNATHHISKNGGGNYVNEYTFMFDIYLPNKSDWKALFQTNLYNGNDAECFIKPTGEVGLTSTGYTSYQLNEKEWYRIVISADLGSFYRIYIDGQLAKEGNAPAVDGAFSLELDKVRFFNDNNGEDGLINVSEITIWDGALTATEVLNLSGFGHTIPTVSPTNYTIYPYLQSPSHNSIIINWHDTSTDADKLEFGISNTLGTVVQSTSEVVSGSYIWHTVKLSNLIPDTEYSYKIYGKGDTTSVFKFRTLPANKDVKKLRFLMIGDTQDHAEKNVEILTKAQGKITELYGSDYQNQLHAIIHSGDIVGSGSTISQYTDQFFVPFAPFTNAVPTLITAGNHELEHPFFYKYIKNDAISGQASTHSDFERYWSKRMGSVLLIGLNSTDQPSLQGIFTQQKEWLRMQLDNAEANDSIDFVFCFVHAHPMSELWVNGSISFVRDQVLPLIKQYSKVQQLTWGHTHGFERGITANTHLNTKGDITLFCNGGGGGTRDRWGEYVQNDYSEIHTTLEQYFYTICEIDTESKSYEFKVYGLGNPQVPLNNVLIDSWSRKLNLTKPAKPVAASVTVTNDNLVLKSSAFAGESTMFSSQFQVFQHNQNTTTTIVDKTRDIKNIYGAINYVPTDKNAGIDISEFVLNKSQLNVLYTYSWRVRYRDNNQKWSDWSDTVPLQLNTGIVNNSLSESKILIDRVNKQIIIKNVMQPENIKLFNIQGMLMQMSPALRTQNNLTLNTDFLVRGMYILQIDNRLNKIIL